MKKFVPIIEKYSNLGIAADNIEYAISAVKDGSKREHVLEILTASYRGMNYVVATNLLEDLYVANGGEFKKENRGGYLYGTFFLFIGLGCCFYIFYVFLYSGVIIRPIQIFCGAIFGVIAGIIFFIKSLMGRYRDTDEPFD